MALLCEYGFNEGSGTTTADSSGNGRTLTANHTTNAWDAGGKNGAGAKYRHDGAMGPSAEQSAYTVMMWVKRTGTWGSGYKQYWGQEFAGNMWLESVQPAYTAEWWDGTAALGSGVTLTLNTWFHVAVVSSGANKTFVIDGVTKTSNTTGDASADFNHSCFVVRSSDAPFIVDELRIFDTALSAGDIQTWMNTPIPRVSLQRPRRLNYGALLQV